MAFEKTFQGLVNAWTRFATTLEDLERGFADLPEHRRGKTEKVYPLSSFEDKVGDLLGETREAIDASNAALVAISDKPDFPLTRESLLEAHRLALEIAAHYAELVSHDVLKVLHEITCKDDQWARWMKALEGYLSPSSAALKDAQHEIMNCWRDFSSSVLVEKPEEPEKPEVPAVAAGRPQGFFF